MGKIRSKHARLNLTQNQKNSLKNKVNRKNLSQAQTI